MIKLPGEGRRGSKIRYWDKTRLLKSWVLLLLILRVLLGNINWVLERNNNKCVYNKILVKKREKIINKNLFLHTLILLVLFA